MTTLCQAFLKPEAIGKDTVETSDIWEIVTNLETLELVHGFMTDAAKQTDFFSSKQKLISSYTKLVKDKIQAGFRYENSDPDTLDEIINFKNLPGEVAKQARPALITLSSLQKKFGSLLPSDLEVFMREEHYKRYDGKKATGILRYVSDGGIIRFFVKSLQRELKSEDLNLEDVLNQWEEYVGDVDAQPKPSTLIPFAKVYNTREDAAAFIYIDSTSSTDYTFRFIDYDGALFEVMEAASIQDFLARHVGN